MWRGSKYISLFSVYDIFTFPIIWLPYDDHQWIKESFFTQEPSKVIENGNFNLVPTMIGSNKDEGILGSASFYKNPDKLKNFWYVSIFIRLRLRLLYFQEHLIS